MQPFALIGSQRTGTTLIRTSLDHHPQIRCHGELFTKKRVASDCYMTSMRASGKKRLVHMVARRRAVFEFLDSLYAQGAYDAIGFKLMYGHLRWLPYNFPMIGDYLKRRDVRVIQVVRHNTLKTLVSRANAERTGVYHVRSGQRPFGKLTISTSDLVRRLDRIRAQDARWEQRLARLHHLLVRYEDFVAQPDAVGRRMLDFLGVDPEISLRSALRKVSPNTLSELIENYEEVAARLRGTTYAGCLDQSDTPG